jgi:hypothetical protein
MQAAVGRIENVGPVDRNEQDSVRMPLEEQVLILVIFHVGLPWNLS